MVIHEKEQGNTKQKNCHILPCGYSLPQFSTGGACFQGNTQRPGPGGAGANEGIAGLIFTHIQ